MYYIGVFEVDMDFVEDILTACLSTARAPPIITKQKRGEFKLRAQIHVIMTMPPASGKTTSMMEDIHNVHKAGDSTKPGILGSINGKTGEFVPGAATLAAGKVLWVDEYQNVEDNVRRALLSLIETGYAQRSLGYNLKDRIKRKTKYGYVNGIKGTGSYDVYSQFSCLLTGTVKPELKRNVIFGKPESEKAWIDRVMFLQRFMHINLTMNPADYFRVISGERLFGVKDYSQYYTKPVIMDDYLDIVKWYQELVNSEEFAFLRAFPDQIYGFVTRNCLDFVRMEALNRALNLTCGKSIPHEWQTRKMLIAYALFNVLTNSLSFSEYRVLVNLLSDNQKTQKEIAVDLNISQSAVSQIEDKLLKYKLLEGNKIKGVYKNC